MADTETTDTKASDKPWTVTTADGNRVLFRGTETDAETFVQNNYPRMHVEPGNDYGDDGPTPDVYLNSPDGKKTFGYDGNDWVEYSE